MKLENKVVYHSKRLLKDKELDIYLELKTEKAKKKFLEDLKEELWQEKK